MQPFIGKPFRFPSETVLGLHALQALVGIEHLVDASEQSLAIYLASTCYVRRQ